MGLSWRCYCRKNNAPSATTREKESEEKCSVRRPRSRLETVVFPVRCDAAGAADLSWNFGGGLASGWLWLSNFLLAAVFSRWPENLYSEQPVRLAFFRGADGARAGGHCLAAGQGIRHGADFYFWRVGGVW